MIRSPCYRILRGHSSPLLDGKAIQQFWLCGTESEGRQACKRSCGFHRSVHTLVVQKAKPWHYQLVARDRRSRASSLTGRFRGQPYRAMRQPSHFASSALGVCPRAPKSAETRCNFPPNLAGWPVHCSRGRRKSQTYSGRHSTMTASRWP